jgi:hypothetical protein
VPCTFNKVYNDEGLYHWDVSVGVRIKSMSEVDFTGENRPVVVENIDTEAQKCRFSMAFRSITDARLASQSARSVSRVF